jgi:hypothetical protein
MEGPGEVKDPEKQEESTAAPKDEKGEEKKETRPLPRCPLCNADPFPALQIGLKVNDGIDAVIFYCAACRGVVGTSLVPPQPPRIALPTRGPIRMPGRTQ